VACPSGPDSILFTTYLTSPYLSAYHTVPAYVLGFERLPASPVPSAQRPLLGPSTQQHPPISFLPSCRPGLAQREWGDTISISLPGPVASLSPLHCLAGLALSRSPPNQSPQNTSATGHRPSPRTGKRAPQGIQIPLAAAQPAFSSVSEPTADSRAGHRLSTEFRYLVGIINPIEPHYAMATPTSIARTQPIAIAARKPRLEPTIEASSNNSNGRAQLSASMSSTTSAESGANIRSRKDRPCDACRRRKSRCVINEGQTSCVLCQFHTQECTFVQSPQPRKRKLNAEGKEESVAKRRFANSFFLLQNPPS
jgi:hypothetical protein